MHTQINTEGPKGVILHIVYNNFIYFYEDKDLNYFAYFYEDIL